MLRAYEGLKNKVITDHLIGFILLGLNNDDIPIVITYQFVNI